MGENYQRKTSVKNSTPNCAFSLKSVTEKPHWVFDKLFEYLQYCSVYYMFRDLGVLNYLLNIVWWVVEQHFQKAFTNQMSTGTEEVRLRLCLRKKGLKEPNSSLEKESILNSV